MLVDDETMVAHGAEWRSYALQQPAAACVHDLGDATVHWLRRAHHATAERECHTLVAEADAEHRQPTIVGLRAEPKILWTVGRTRARRDNNRVNRRGERREQHGKRADIRVVRNHRRRASVIEFRYELDEIEGVGVVIVEEEDV